VTQTATATLDRAAPAPEGVGAVDPHRQLEVLQALRAHVPEDCLLVHAEDTRPYECDGLTMFRQLPMLVALPRTEQQVAAVLRICHRLGVPVVPRGAGTSLSGGALPHAQGVLLSMARLNQIVSLDPVARIAVVQPGVRNQAISEQAARHGLFYAPDPSSQIACSIGGNVAENSGGVHCVKYGLTLHNVLRVRALLSDGAVAVFGSEALDSPGLDLLAVLIGSEGMLAVATEVSVRLLPRAQLARCAIASFNDVETAGNAVAALIGAGIIPAGLEMMDRAAVAMVEPFVHAGYDLDAAALLLCESDGTPAEVADEIKRIEQVLRKAGATRISVSSDEAERLKFWAGRKNAFPAAGRVSPDYYCTDGTIPRKRLGEVLKAIEAMESKYGLRCPNVFHAGDGNLHPLVLYDGSDPGSRARAEAFGEEILELCVRVGGTVTGEHGVGVEKLGTMCSQFDAATMESFFGVRRAFDPRGILNPGKAIPTLARCAEYGRMHVHQGQTKFPDLPRF
jgi:glycolate oxidase